MSPGVNFYWSVEKNAELHGRYGISFEDALLALEAGGLLDEREHPNSAKYGHQRQLIVEIDGYVWVVPYVQDESGVFLKTMFPSRREQAAYLRRS